MVGCSIDLFTDLGVEYCVRDCGVARRCVSKGKGQDVSSGSTASFILLAVLSSGRVYGST